MANAKSVVIPAQVGMTIIKLEHLLVFEV